MQMVDSVVAVYEDHPGAELAVKKLAASGFAMKNLSVVGKGYHTDEKVMGFYTTGDRVKIWACAVRSGAASGACSLEACSSRFPSLATSSCSDTLPRRSSPPLKAPSSSAA